MRISKMLFDKFDYLSEELLPLGNRTQVLETQFSKNSLAYNQNKSILGNKIKLKIYLRIYFSQKKNK